jgi:hypothetical protein
MALVQKTELYFYRRDFVRTTKNRKFFKEFFEKDIITIRPGGSTPFRRKPFGRQTFGRQVSYYKKHWKIV